MVYILAEQGFGSLIKTVVGLQSVQEEVAMTGQELMNLRATFLFSAFGAMALAQIVKTVTDKFEEMRKEMVETWSEIEYQAVTVSTVLVGTGDVADEVSDKMLELGRKTEWTAREAGQGMEYLSRAGLSLDETLNSVKAVMDMATATNIDMEEAARFAAGAYRGWNLEAEESNHVQQNVSMVTAEVAHAARNSRQEVTELADAFKYATATAQTIGWSMEELTSGLMIVADNMINAGMAGRSFRRVMTRMGKIAGTVSSGIDASREAVDRLGIELQDAQGNLIGFEELIRRLDKATEELTATQRVNLFQQIAGMRGMNALSAAVDEGADTIADLKLELKSSAALQALYTEHGREARDMMKDIYQQVRNNEKAHGRQVDILDSLTENYDMSLESAMKLQDVINETKDEQQKFNDVLEESTIVSEMASEKLKTLEGTQILLKSSIEAMWAELASGSFAYVMMEFNRLLRNITDWISRWPGPLKTVVGFMVLFMSVIGRTIPRLLMFSAMIQIQQAALASLRLEMYEMRKERIQNLNLINLNEKAVKNAIITHLVNTEVLSQEEAQLWRKKFTLEQVRATIQQTNIAEWEHVSRVAAGNVKKAQGSVINEIYATTGNQVRDSVNQQAIAFRQLSRSMAPIIIQSMLMMASMGLLMHGFTTGDEKVMAFGTALLGLTITIRFARAMFDSLRASIVHSTVAMGSFIGITLLTYYILTETGNKIQRVVAPAFLFLGAAILYVMFVSNALDKSLGGIITAIGLIANGIIIITDLIWNWTDGIMVVDEELTGNTLLDSLLSVADGISYVADSIKWIIELFGNLINSIDLTGDKFDWLAKLSDDLMGHSIIPENFERGVSRIRETMKGMRQEMNFGLPEGFGGRNNKIIASKPQFQLDMSNFTTKKEVEPEEMQRLVNKGVEEALTKWERRARRSG